MKAAVGNGFRVRLVTDSAAALSCFFLIADTTFILQTQIVHYDAVPVPKL
jgi:hypothetical protein